MSHVENASPSTTSPSTVSVSRDVSTHTRLDATAVSPGIGIGVALWLDQIGQAATRRTHEFDVERELESFELARQQVLAELEHEIAFVAMSVGPREAAMVQTHVSMANDTTFAASVRSLIQSESLTAAQAIAKVLEQHGRSLSEAGSEYLRDRACDLRDVFLRVARAAECSDTTIDDLDEDLPIILLAEELRPSHLMSLRRLNVQGIATVAGGRTSHAAILARALRIPAVSGIGLELCEIHDGDEVIIDARHSTLVIHPDGETTRKYSQELREIGQLWKKLQDRPGGETLTSDGVRLSLMANVGSLHDAETANQVQADGIGMLRSEFFYLAHRQAPDEDSEVGYYRRVLQAGPSGPLTIRTFDIGGDKTLPYFSSNREANPFLGWRSIRLSFERPQLFVQQIRSIIRTAYDAERAKLSEVRLLFPMVTVKSEWLRIQRLVNVARDTLGGDPDSFLTADAPIKLGVMIEVPSAALCIDHFLPLVDFVSIGTNDLVQYLTAADRDNPKVSKLCQVLSPAMLRLLYKVIGRCNAANVPVSVCGEMAGSVRSFLPLLGMGLRQFSMSPSMIPAIRYLAQHVSTEQAEAILGTVLQLDSSERIHEVLDDFLSSQRNELSALLLG